RDRLLGGGKQLPPDERERRQQRVIELPPDGLPKTPTRDRLLGGGKQLPPDERERRQQRVIELPPDGLPK
ncbi:hypothetical protein C3E95_28425, partial [Klebsiella pneumoniae]